MEGEMQRGNKFDINLKVIYYYMQILKICNKKKINNRKYHVGDIVVFKSKGKFY
jgi:hypothetical protein